MTERNMESKRNKKGFICVAVFACALMFSVSLFSAFYVASEADHDCCGEGCPICAHIDQCATMLKSVGEGGVVLGAALLFAVIYLTAIQAAESILCSFSLVTLKVRMNH